MATQLARLWVDGADWSDVTIAALELTGGRSTPTGRPDVTTIGLTIELPANRRLPRIGDRVDVAGWLPGLEATTRAALFTGNVTDVALERGAAPDGGDILSLVAADPMRLLDGVAVGDVPWPIEAWRERVAHVWDSARAAAGTPEWMQPGQDLIALLPFVPHNGWLWSRDVDHRPALDVLYAYLDPNACAVYYRPSTLWPAPADPAAWAPSAWIRSGFMTHPGGAEPTPTGHAGLVHAVDPSPRYWMNLADTATDWRLTAMDPDTVTADKPDPDTVTYTARADQATRDRYGNTAKQVRTELVTSYLGAPQTAPQDLADGWLAAWQYPAMNLDKVTVSLRADDIAAVGPTAATETWALLAHGPAQVARYSRWDLLPGTTAWWFDPRWFEWMVESTRLRLLDDGWQIEVGMAPTYSYTGGIPTSPDPRNSWDAVAGYHPTWDELAAAHASWDDLATTPHPHPAVVEAA